MDFWSRLIGGGRLPPAKQAANSPQQRLAIFKRATEQLSQSWRKSKGAPINSATVDDIALCLESLRHMLLDESRASAPHPCIEHAASLHIYVAATALASLDPNGAAARETINFLNVLVDSEDEDFLRSPAFADATIGLAVKMSAFEGGSAETKAVLFELLFSIAAKLRLRPAYMKYWFKPDMRREEGLSTKISGTRPFHPREEFPLFYLLLNNVHIERRVGEFARTGLLYIIESAAHSETLEKWIIDSDLAAMMASGLGALYSQLNRHVNLIYRNISSNQTLCRRLACSYAKGAVPAVIAFSDISKPLCNANAQETSFPEFQFSVKAFLTYLNFWQDTLEHCASAEIRQTLLDHFEYLFLQQVLYPSLLESSDVDGSSVAVLNYLRLTLETICHADLSHCVLHFLLAVRQKTLDKPKTLRPAAIARRRKSESLINQNIDREQVSPELFNLVDLVLINLRSHSQQTITATLRLLLVLLGPHHGYAIAYLIKTTKVDGGARPRHIDDHEEDIDSLLNMAEALALHDDLEISYGSYLQDANNLVELHSCSGKLLALPNIESLLDGKFPHTIEHEEPLQAHPVLVRLDDPLLQSVLALLTGFLGNDIETNLALTQVISCLASCGYTRLESWLMNKPIPRKIHSNQFSDPHGALQHDRFTSSSPLPTPDEDRELYLGPSEILEDSRIGTETKSPVFRSLDAIIKQVQGFSEEIEDFDTYLAERRHVFKVGDEIENALKDSAAPPSKSTDESKTASSTRKSNLPQIAAVSERLLSGQSSAPVSRSSSPRGRQRGEQTAATAMGRLSHPRISPSPSSSKVVSSVDSRSPFRRGLLSSTPPRGLRNPMSPGNALQQKIKIPTHCRLRQHQAKGVRSSDESSIRSDSIGPEALEAENAVEVTLSHLLTNVIILQEFLFELAAVIEVRASLFGEVTLD